MSLKNHIVEYKNLLVWGFKHDVINLLMTLPLGIMVLISWSPLVPALFSLPSMPEMDVLGVLLGALAMGVGGNTFTWFMFKAFILDSIRLDKQDEEIAAERERIEAERVQIQARIRREQQAREQAAADRYTKKLLDLYDF
jgi:Zn-dependent protease with chaperone function